MRLAGGRDRRWSTTASLNASVKAGLWLVPSIRQWSTRVPSRHPDQPIEVVSAPSTATSKSIGAVPATGPTVHWSRCLQPSIRASTPTKGARPPNVPPP